MLLIRGVFFSQNDIDALRYSQIGVGGNARFISMGGALGALGANPSCLSYNPAGIGIYRKGEWNASLKFQFSNITATHNTNSENSFKPSFNFNGFGMAGSREDNVNKDVRHSFGIVNNQLQNFNNNISISGFGMGKSIINDFLNEAKNYLPSSLNPYYSGMAFNTVLIDTMKGNYYGFIDPNKNMFQSKLIDTKGQVNEIALGYAYAYQDKFYLGFSVGMPRVNYEYTGVYKEADVNDSLRIYKDANGVIQSTYPNQVWYYYSDQAATNLLGGFKSMSYSETYKTTGSGYNLKIGAIYRVSDALRFGVNFHSPSVLNLTDVYSYTLSTNWDNGQTYSQVYPENSGYYKYKVITPMRYGASMGYVYNKLFVLGIDYESVDYGQSRLTSSNPGDFSSVNKTIRSKYKRASNIRSGMEFNVKPVFIRLGYSMYGSPFGKVFSGTFVRHTYSGGIGFRNDKWMFDMAFVKERFKEDYYMYNPAFAHKSNVLFSGTTFVTTLGCKF